MSQLFCYQTPFISARDAVLFARNVLQEVADNDRDAAYAEDAERARKKWTLADVQPGRQYKTGKLTDAVRTFVHTYTKVCAVADSVSTIEFVNAQEAVDWYNRCAPEYIKVAP